MSGPGMIIGAVATIASAVLVIVTGEPWLLVIPALLFLVLLATTGWRVRIDATGLTARSFLGFPRTHRPIEEITGASAVPVRALHEFGGWGRRVGREGRTGIIMRSGEALEVTETGGRVFVATITDAAAAAALVNTYADRDR